MCEMLSISIPLAAISVSTRTLVFPDLKSLSALFLALFVLFHLISFAAIFAISMVMAPVYAVGHLAIDSAKMTIKQKKGEIDLKIKVGAKIQKDESGLFGGALLG